MPKKLPKEVDKKFNEQVQAIRAWDAARSQEAREAPVDKAKSTYPIFNRPELVSFADAYKEKVTAKQRAISDYQRRTEPARLKQENGIKLGFREKMRMKRADRKIEKMNRDLKVMNDHFKEQAQLGTGRGDANDRAFFEEMSKIIDQNQKSHEQDQNWTDKGDPTKSILKSIGYETPEMKDNREAKEDYQFNRYGMPEAPSNDDAVDYADPNLVIDFPHDVSPKPTRQVNSAELGIKSQAQQPAPESKKDPAPAVSKKPLEKNEL